MRYDLNRVHVFHCVYAENSISKAAEKLHISQPAVSQQIKKLEEEIKTPLFSRLHKRIVPTSAAHHLFKTVQPFLKELDREIEHLSIAMDKPYGSLMIGSPIIFGTTYLPQICSEFRKIYPDVRFSVRFEESDVLIDLLNKGELDFALIDFFSAYDQLPGKPELYAIEPLMLEYFVLACSRAYYEKRINKNLSLNDLLSLEYLTDENEPIILRHWFWYYYKKRINDFNIVMAIEAHQALMECIRNGMGVGLTSEHLWKEEIEKKEIIPIFPKPEKLVNTISIVALKDSVLTLTQRKFRNFLKNRFSDGQAVKGAV
ncbi:LysR family transcriptional regulator [Desulfospira joergensenii]|uniref:LysR family transcriptional regulator n=1 Tax=Desulfospira joergensenii TaxID=53329 RepID=UPI0003B4FB7D|nr:LysR family transcriptional regulator [Desulfospira joergensenii]